MTVTLYAKIAARPMISYDLDPVGVGNDGATMHYSLAQKTGNTQI
jgi:hypothetical protein